MSSQQFVESVKQYLAEHPTATDTELKKYVKSLKYSQNCTNCTNCTNNSTNYARDQDSLSRHSRLQLFNPFSTPMNFFDRFNHMSNLLDSEFNDFKIDEFSDVKLEPTDRGYSRSKTSYVTYHNGEKKKKTVEVSQRFDDKGDMKMHKRKTYEDGKGKRVEEYFPDGTKNVSEYPNNKVLENK
jgi:hypothetical protein